MNAELYKKISNILLTLLCLIYFSELILKFTPHGLGAFAINVLLVFLLYKKYTIPTILFSLFALYNAMVNMSDMLENGIHLYGLVFNFVHVVAGVFFLSLIINKYTNK